MDEYKNNSDRSREKEPQSNLPAKRVEKVTTGLATVRKRGEMRKLADIFLQKDVSSVKSYVLMDVLIPAIKKAVSDIITNGTDMLLYGESGGRKKSSNATRVSYSSCFERPRDSGTSDRYAQRARTGYSYDEILFETRGDAEEVLNMMNELMDNYHVVSVADLFDMAGVTGNPYTDNKFGWTDITSAEPVRVRDGYVLKLPKAMPIN